MSEDLTPNWCAHYQSPLRNDSCKAGISFDSMSGIPFEKRPCFWKNRDQCAKCPKQEWPSQEKLQSDRESIDLAMRKMTMTLPLISRIKKENKGSDWKGVEECPVCQGEISITHSGYNGHCAAKCETENCINFRE